jgi:translation elongation factor EF-Tu-like GTPase
MSTDAIVLLKQDHKEVRRLFRAFAKADEDDTQKKAQLVEQMLELLTDHEYFTAKTTVLIESVEHHIEEEEEEWFPKVREGLDRKRLRRSARTCWI